MSLECLRCWWWWAEGAGGALLLPPPGVVVAAASPASLVVLLLCIAFFVHPASAFVNTFDNNSLLKSDSVLIISVCLLHEVTLITSLATVQIAWA